NGIISELSNRSEAAAITLTNSNEFTCKTDTNTFLAYSFDFDKIDLFTLPEIKEKIGLADYNVSLALDSFSINGKNDPHAGKQIYAINLNVLYCNDGAQFVDVNACIHGSCSGNLEKRVLNLKVSK
ncbi:MAG: hypothetical protein HN878_02670, partial [Candidatus Diapherotrites archaeon]|nr:hypothetical protein [Candidatus Diapherotrites archaeon]